MFKLFFSQSQPISPKRHRSAPSRWLGAQTAGSDCDWLNRRNVSLPEFFVSAKTKVLELFYFSVCFSFVSILFQLCGEFNGAKLKVKLTNDTYDFERACGTKGGTLRARTATLLTICSSYISNISTFGVWQLEKSFTVFTVQFMLIMDSLSVGEKEL